MAKVVLQLINDSGEIEDESTLIDGATPQAAKRVFSNAVHDTNWDANSSIELVVEFHYKDGDVGAYDDIAVQSLWAQFTRGHEASHILIRPGTDEGQNPEQSPPFGFGLIRSYKHLECETWNS